MDEDLRLTKVGTIKFIATAIIVTGFIIWQKLDHTTTAQVVLNGIKNDQFYGRVDSVYRDEQDHNIEKVKLINGYIYALYPEWESKVEKGDSLSKRKGTTTVVVIKKDGTKINFDYKELVKTFKN